MNQQNSHNQAPVAEGRESVGRETGTHNAVRSSDSVKRSLMRMAVQLSLGIFLMMGVALAGPPTPIVVTTNAGAVSGSVDVLKLCGPAVDFNCSGPTVTCPTPINISGPNKTVKMSCKAPFTVVGIQFALTVQSQDGTYAQSGGGMFLTSGKGTASVTGTSGTLTLTVGK